MLPEIDWILVKFSLLYSSKSVLLRCGDLSAGEGGHGLLLLDHGDALMSELFTVFREKCKTYSTNLK